MSNHCYLTFMRTRRCTVILPRPMARPKSDAMRPAMSASMSTSTSTSSSMKATGDAKPKVKPVLKKKPAPNPVPTQIEFVKTESSRGYVDNNFLGPAAADELQAQCAELELSVHPTFQGFGQTLTMNRSIGFYSHVSAGYKFSGVRFYDGPPPLFLDEIMGRVNSTLGTDFNGVLVNYYADGTDYISPHSVDERGLATGGIVAAISLGGGRKFRVREKVKGGRGSIIADVRTAHGQLLVMEGAFQREFTHEIPRESTGKARFSLTFRTHKE